MKMALYETSGREIKQDLTDLYVQYLKALQPYNEELKVGSLSLLKIALDEVNSAISRVDTDIALFYDDNNLIGFAFIGKYPNSVSSTSIFIQEFFITNELWRNGYGRKAVELICKKYIGNDIALYILNGNRGAYDFWNVVMNSLAYSELSSSGLVSRPDNARFDDCIFQYWRA